MYRWHNAIEIYYPISETKSLKLVLVSFYDYIVKLIKATSDGKIKLYLC